MEEMAELRRQLEGLDELRSIVKTMKALSAASIRQFEKAIATLAAYALTIDRGLTVALKEEVLPGGENALGGHGRGAAIVFGSDHGLCGRFNEEVVELACANLVRRQGEREPPLVLAVGARAASRLEHQGQQLDGVFGVPSSAAQITRTVQLVLIKIEDWIERASVGEVELFYNQHSRGSGHRPTTLRLLPLDPERLRIRRAAPWPSRSLPTHSMERHLLLSRLLRQHLFVSMFRACAESLCSEHASRLAAMSHAERSLEERLLELTMLFHRARQDAVTAELLDLVGGFEASREDADAEVAAEPGSRA